jgi:hypothetical protein
MYPRWNDCTDQISVRSDSWLGHQGAKIENAKSAIINSWTNGWIISKFSSQVHLVRIHYIIPVFLIWPTFQGQRSKFVWVGYQGTFLGLLAWNFVLEILFQSNSWLGHQGAKTKNTKSATTPQLMAGSSPNFFIIWYKYWHLLTWSAYFFRIIQAFNTYCVFL